MVKIRVWGVRQTNFHTMVLSSAFKCRVSNVIIGVLGACDILLATRCKWMDNKEKLCQKIGVPDLPSGKFLKSGKLFRGTNSSDPVEDSISGSGARAWETSMRTMVDAVVRTVASGWIMSRSYGYLKLLKF